MDEIRGFWETNGGGGRGENLGEERCGCYDPKNYRNKITNSSNSRHTGKVEK